MPYQLVRDGDYPDTDLPNYAVYDADEYQDTTRIPRPIGYVWAIGTRGVTGRHIPTGTRYALAGSWDVSPVLPVAAYGDAARALIAAYES